MLMDWEKVDLSLDEIITKTTVDKRRHLPSTKSQQPIKRNPKINTRNSQVDVSKRPTPSRTLRKGATVSKNSTRPAARPALSLANKKFTVRNEKAIQTHSQPKPRTDKPREKIILSTDRKAIIDRNRGVVVSVRNELAAKTDEIREGRRREETWHRSRSRSRSRGRAPSRSSAAAATERLEIRITNDLAGTVPVASSSPPTHTPIIPQIPNSGLTSSHFRTPMAVMDLYTGRYARPALEPYRPPPIVQQFHRALNETIPMGTIPAQYMPLQQPQQQQYQQYQQPYHQMGMRKPYDS